MQMPDPDQCFWQALAIRIRGMVFVATQDTQRSPIIEVRFSSSSFQADASG